MRSFLLIPAITMVLLADRFGMAATQEAATSTSRQAVTPLIHGHAHNDYLRTPDRSLKPSKTAIAASRPTSLP